MEGKKILVIGLGASGSAAARFLLKAGADVYGVDNDEMRLSSIPRLKSFTDEDLSTFDLCIVSPGVPPHQPHYKAAKESGIETIGETELACRFLKNPSIGITGTNGKTTVTLLVAHVLNYAGKKAHAVGNVGAPLIECVGTDGILVIELSSFQLETMHTKILDTAVILNITADHLDRYTTMKDYAQAKTRIGACVKEGGSFYVGEKCYQEFSGCFGAQSVEQISLEKFEYILPPEYRGRRDHDTENLMAAFVLCAHFGVNEKLFFEAFKSFKKPPHRIEFVERIKGIDYINDSKGTNIDAVIRAVESLPGKLVLIVGGVDKGSSYGPWIEVFRDKVKGICAIGQAAEKIKQEIETMVPVHLCATLDDAVRFATSLANSGESVLLSPGCSSYDMFRDYAHRGDEFKKIVNLLGREVK